MQSSPTYVLVTGANRGIGRATVASLLDVRDDTRVFLGTRSVERGERALEAIAADRRGAEDRVEVVQLDVTDEDSVGRAADRVSRTLGGSFLYGVVNNAGIGGRQSSTRQVLDVNVRGPRRVSRAFAALLHPDDGRIVNVSSAAGPKFVAECRPEHRELLTDSEVTWDEIDQFIETCLAAEREHGDLESAGIGDGSDYGLSKACLNAFTMAYARRHPEITVHACTPGFIETDMTRWLADREGEDPDDLGMKSPAEGTRAQTYLLFGDPPGNGLYFGSDARRSPLDRYRDPGEPPYVPDNP